MTKHLIKISAIVLCLYAVSSAYPDEPRILAVVDTSKDIYAGEGFTYQIILDGIDQPGEADLSPLAQFNPRSAGGGNNSQSSITIINGKTTQNVVKQYVMNYVLTARQIGHIFIPSVSVKVNGKTYQTNPVEINVVQPGTTDQIELEATLSEQRCFVGQPVILTIKFYVYSNIGKYQFDVPALNNDTFFIEDVDGGSGQGKQTQITRNNRDAIQLTYSKVLIAKRAGDLDLGVPSVSADVAVGRSRSRDGFFDDFFNNTQYKRFAVSAQPLKLTVLPLPQQGKPKDFYGLVGRYMISADASPKKVSVGDPITLTIKIGGEFLKPVQWPQLEQIPELADNFKIPSQKASPAIENGLKIFTQTIRASNEKVTQIPAIPLTFFDTDKGQYVTASTEPIKLEVQATKILTTADVEGKDFSPMAREVEAVKKGLSANYENQDCLLDVGFSLVAVSAKPAYIAGLALPLMILFASIITKALVNSSPEQEAKKRRRKAAAKATGQLKKVHCDLLKSHPELLSEQMKQFIGQRFDKVAGSLTADDCFNVIISQTGDNESAAKFRDIINDCESARYAPVGREFNNETIQTACSLIRAIEKKSKL